ncbi:MAG: hypothetical protein RBT41_06295 [Clostridia bacterium]|jgi:predicted nucleotide-binding protein (sugar kinase/HSP70/actin superfamily)|nr:hypothetical protein [Clostridia bacterium]
MLVSFPHMDKMHLALEKVCQTLQVPYLTPPLPGPETLKRGQELAPEGSCLPFCLVLGNMRQALDMGADAIMMLGGSGPCRFGYFVYLAVKILKAAGYEFTEMIIDKGYHRQNYKILRQMAPVSLPALIQAAHLGWELLCGEEILDRIGREYAPLATDRPGFNEFMASARSSLRKAASPQEAILLKRSVITHLHSLEMYPADSVIRVGLIGDIYTLLEPFANHQVEDFFAARNVAVYKEMSVSGWLPNILLPWKKGVYRRNLLENAQPYLTSSVGGFGLETVANARVMGQKHIDGLVQLFPMGCMPEIVARSALDKMCRDQKTPALFVTLDQHHSPTGFETRLEAFLDVLYTKKQQHAV